jgi:hypothetical protein
MEDATAFGSTDESEQPVLIPIHSDGDLPEWAVLELNGELIRPKESPDGKENPTSDCLVGPGQVELGSVQFVDAVGSVEGSFTVWRSLGFWAC